MKALILLFILFILTSAKENRKIPELPLKLKIGYAWAENFEITYDKVLEAVKNGLNVIIWFALDMSSNSNSTKPEFKGGPDYSKVVQTIKNLTENNYNVINLISVGGWGAPHPDTRFTAEEYYEEWIKFNKRISNEESGFFGFDGLDWDIEGTDDINSSINYFTYEELDLMGKFSKLLKNGGYIVSMAPAESYIDSSTDEFSLSLLYNYPEWENELPNFTYHGRNAYAYLIAKYSIDTFDFISVQLYESWSHALYKFRKEHQFFGDILYNIVDNYTKGYLVDFSTDEKSGMDKKTIKIPQNKLVIGLANAWAFGKALFIDEKNITEGYHTLVKKNKDVRGFMFWSVGYEGDIPTSEDVSNKTEFFMAKVLNSVFNQPTSNSCIYSIPLFLEFLLLLYL